MRLGIFEDFLSLAHARNFKLAADQRRSTQSAFSRRIHALEAWAGTTLIDRSVKPVKLTPDGHTFFNLAERIVRQAHHLRSSVQLDSKNGRRHGTVAQQ